METKKNRFPIAAIFFAICAVCDLGRCLIYYYDPIFYVINVLTFLLVAGVLFTRKTGVLLLCAVATTAIVPAIRYIQISTGDYFRLYHFDDSARFYPSIFLLILIALWVFIKAQKPKAIVSKLWWIPVALQAIVSFSIIYDTIPDFDYLWIYPTPFIPCLGLVLQIIRATSLFFAFLFLCYWAKSPQKKERIKATPASNANWSFEDAKIYCSLGKHIVLLLFTFGIWTYIWIWRVTKYLNRAPNAEQYNPTKKLLLCMFIPFYQIYWLYKHGQRIDSLSAAKKLNGSDMATLCLILGLFIPIVAIILMQDKLNAICTVQTPTDEPSAPKQALDTAEALRKYKQLLDDGVITQEEFDAKKKQLLGL